jgi:hypothetical protein
VQVLVRVDDYNSVIVQTADKGRCFNLAVWCLANSVACYEVRQSASDVANRLKNGKST